MRTSLTLISLTAVLVLQCFVACSSIFSNSEETDHGLVLDRSSKTPDKNPDKSSEKKLDKNLVKTGSTDEEIAKLRTDVQSLQEAVLSIRRSLELLRKGQRTGLYDEQPQVQKLDLPGDDDSAKLNPALASGRINLTEKPAEEVKNEQKNPTGLVAEAELKMRRSQFGEAVTLLSEVNKSFPNLSDDGHSLILLAECWNAVKEFDNALVSLRNFYLKFPNSSEKLKAKLLEGQAYNGLQSKEKAINVYKEIVALGPQTSYAQAARAEMQRLRDEQ